ncbi:hypothetical protein GTA08_BOTSDO11965 [Neofusicoccum parvum]|uniref:Uncharacterized protein n=1 Tax=Neofusicoccum parvum TaxID=310453 RepID=A0ACB5RSQ6_9PEZI|nr:hypothetical protein GTA08_BOTSDO11965 [Neofusicoccum parvum]
MTEVELHHSRTPSEEPTRVEGIQTRKKKEKKAKPAKAPKTATSTPSQSRTGTPGPAEKAPSPEIEPEAPAEKDTPSPVADAVVEAAPPAEEPPKPAVTPASIIAKLQGEGAITHDTLENMFKSFPQGPNERQITLQDVGNRDRQYTLSDEAIRGVLERGEAQRLGGEDGRLSSRVLVTPAGTILRGLSRDEEDRYLELEAGLGRKEAAATAWHPTREPVFDLERIVRNLNVRAVVDKSNTLRDSLAARQRKAIQLAAGPGQQANANGTAASAAKAFDEAANYNDEFIMPASPTIQDNVVVAVPSAVDNADRAASTSPTSSSSPSSSSSSSSAGSDHSSSLLDAPFENHYIHINGITLSDAAAPVLGIDMDKLSGAWAGSPPPLVRGCRRGGSILSQQELEMELNAEKQRANEFTKKLNAAIKRNRKVVGAAGH